MVPLVVEIFAVAVRETLLVPHFRSTRAGNVAGLELFCENTRRLPPIKESSLDSQQAVLTTTHILVRAMH
jgi:hypothetical protein